MSKKFQTFSFIIILAISIIGCANRGTPSGGEKDTIPPEIIRSVPENFSTDFSGNEIRIYFDEYIKLKNIQKQLIVSPPMDPAPEIMPLSAASKYIKITIKDTLEPNTTYALNFGQSVVDNNEENPYPYYRYVFSTGETIDSLSVKGSVMDAESRITDTFISVMLYPVDSTYNDSIIYKQKPKYITNTLDSTTTFSIDNIKEGKYLLVALKEENSNFTFDPKTDKIGFYKDFIDVPKDTLYEIKLFNEVVDFKGLRPKQSAGQKIAFPYEGDPDKLTINILSDTPNDFSHRITKQENADTLYYWYKPKLELDSTQFILKKHNYNDTLKHRFRSLDKDSLTVVVEPRGTLKYDEPLKIKGSIPFTKLDKSLITILDQDSLKVDYSFKLDSLDNTYHIDFNKKEAYKYNVEILPNALEDFFGNTNDTIQHSVNTKEYAEYSDIRLTLVNAEYPVIVQLVDNNDKVFYEDYVSENRPIDFEHITPKDYYVKVIFDINKNGKWDSGNFLKRIPPERVSYMKEFAEARANWAPQIIFTLD
ncbi:Ig-like domain-containing protein [Ichthyenterobacterium sp. W332]|uniref:Ig-like domain-containing protein n=1 Tax=Microcosmobacter mediterraneus TaxID=3075607 RepID=A0ABU2YKM5_9FLAO|nr:Ig-like domain-containing protein [Ichthyenterobacterium sp. W332]MDT0558239.1 Ig-like domain-containing protein [Ichthyenterobacterium sp. W332]